MMYVRYPLLLRQVEDLLHERNALDLCRGRNFSNVALAIDHGQVAVPGMVAMEGRKD